MPPFRSMKLLLIHAALTSAVGSPARALAPNSPSQEPSPLNTIVAPSGSHLYCLAVSPDGTLVASAGAGGTIILWDAHSRKLRHTIAASKEDLFALAFSPDGRALASSGDDGTIRLWDPFTGQKLREFTGHDRSVVSLSISPRGTSLASGSFERCAKLWNLSEGSSSTIARRSSSELMATFVCYTLDDRYVAVSRGNSIEVWSTITLTRLWAAETKGSVRSLAISNDRKTLASVSSPPNSEVTLWNTVTGERVRSFAEGTYIWTIAFSPDNHSIATGNENGDVRLWDLSGHERCLLGVHHGAVSALAFFPDARILASCGHDGRLMIWPLLAARSRSR
jgi:WD40 repeat protein